MGRRTAGGLALLGLLAFAACGGALDRPTSARRVSEPRAGGSAAAPSAPAAPVPASAPQDARPSAGTPAPPAACCDPDRAPDARAAAIVRPDLAGGCIVAGTTRHRLLLFTFDDGPHPVHTRRLLRELARARVRGVFFVVARRLAQESGFFAASAAVLREVAAAGHVIASHTLEHVHLDRIDERELERQVVGAEELIARVVGARPWLIRPPGGARSPQSDAYLASRGYTQMLWNIGTGDWLVRTPEDVVERFRAGLAARAARGLPGGVVVLHDSHPWSVQALRQIVRHVERSNCALLASGEELYDIVDDPGLFVVPRPAGASPSTMAPPVALAPEVLAARQARVRARAVERCRRLGAVPRQVLDPIAARAP